jgi:hypothetical protein
MASEYRTARCAAHGHPEFTLVVTKRLPVPELERLLLDYFEDGVAGGTRFRAGQTVQLGWATLRLALRADGTLGVEEADMDNPSGWSESVDRALMATWLQKEVARSVGLDEQLEFPHHEQVVTICGRVLASNSWVLTRAAQPDPTHSGWMFGCVGGDHDHNASDAFGVAQLIAVAWKLPFVTQFIALPAGTTVLVQGPGRIRPKLYLNDRELTPRPGSYLAALIASGASDPPDRG